MMCRAFWFLVLISCRSIVWSRGVSVTRHQLQRSWLGEPLDESGQEVADFRGGGRCGEKESENEADDGLPDAQAHIAVSELDDRADDERRAEWKRS